MCSPSFLDEVPRFGCETPFGGLACSNYLSTLLLQATGALDTATEAVLYRLLQRHCHSYVSIGHRPELLQWHTHVLQHAGGPCWRFCTKQDFLCSERGAGVLRTQSG